MFKSANPTSLINANSLKWELPALYSAAILSSQQQVSVDHHISRETSSLLEKEVATPKQVSFNHLCIYTDSIILHEIHAEVVALYYDSRVGTLEI